MCIYIYIQARGNKALLRKKKQTTSILKDPKLNYWDSRTAKSTLATEKPASLSDQGDQHLGCHKQWGEVWRSFKEKHKRYVANIWNRYWIWMPFLYILQGPCSLETNLWMIRLIWKKSTHCTFPRVTLQNIQLNTHTHTVIFHQERSRATKIAGVPRRRWSSWRRLAQQRQRRPEGRKPWRSSITKERWRDWDHLR